MNVKSIFKLLVTIVACVVVGAFFLNIIMPNALVGVASATEDMIFNATGISLDINGDSRGGQNTSNSNSYAAEVDNNDNKGEKAAGVKGFSGGGGTP